MTMRVVHVAVVLVALGAAARSARGDADADKATALLQQVATAPTADARLGAAKQLADLAPHAIDAIGASLGRQRTTTLAQRSAALMRLKLPVPDKHGRFATPNREVDQQMREDDEVDWLVVLSKADLHDPAVGEIMADVAALRALAATRVPRTANVIFDVGFAAETMIYRDECGRQLRAMSPYSIPTLQIQSQSKRADRRRYSNYQLERLDRQEPSKALLAAANDEQLEITILDAWRESKHREAVGAVLSKIDDDAPRVRAAARKTWLGYVTGPAPPPAPKKKLALPGGKLTDEEMPLWFTYRELADQLLRKRAEELWAETYDEDDKIDVAAMSKRLFEYYDNERATRDGVVYDEARKLAGAGDLAGATALLDRLLVENPERPERGQMAPVFLAYADQLAGAQKWPEAAAAYSKAHGLDPKGEHATHALAAQHLALGKALEAQGKDGSAHFRKASELEPHNAAAREAAGGRSSSRWMLLAGGFAAVLAALFLGIGLMRRRAA